MQITVETTILAPPELVFAVMTDVPNWSKIIRGIDAIELLTPGPIAVGSRFRETRRMHGRKAVEEMTVADIRPPRRLVMTAENHGTRYVAMHEIRPAPGGSRLTFTFGGQPVSLAARGLSFMSKMMVEPVRRQLQADLDDIKTEAERRAREADAQDRS